VLHPRQLRAGARPEGHWRPGGNKADGGLGVGLPGVYGPTDSLGAMGAGDIRPVLALSAGAQTEGHGQNGDITAGGGLGVGLTRAGAPERKRKAKKKRIRVLHIFSSRSAGITEVHHARD
jgi:hypothetical protein